MERVPATTPITAPAANRALEPRAPGTSARQGQGKHLLTQALLWTLAISDPDRYTLKQAWRMTLAALQAVLLELGRTVSALAVSRWHSVSADWKKSGEAAERQRRRGQVKSSRR